MQAQRSLILGLTLSLGWLGACGDDEKPKDKPVADAGNPGPKNDGGNGKPTTITCGSQECTAPSLGGGPLSGLLSSLGDIASPEVCCAGAAEDVCGVSQAFLAPGQCFEQNQEGKPNSACTGFSLGNGLPLSIPGCCKPTGQCGLDLTLLGVGCMERTEVSEVASSGSLGSLLGSGVLGDAGVDLGDAGIAPLEAIPCEYEAPATNDAGTDAGGDPGDAGSDAGAGDPDAGTDAG